MFFMAGVIITISVSVYMKKSTMLAILIKPSSTVLC